MKFEVFDHDRLAKFEIALVVIEVPDTRLVQLLASRSCRSE
ncbi:MAG TPA: hypothetical protein VEK11_12435 [Thermoanaerobaculia bacterium]|nr:hypothetical protein [Thermoanaerobaculia bacterium]